MPAGLRNQSQDNSTAPKDLVDAAAKIRLLAESDQYQLPNGQRRLRYYVALGKIIRALDNSYGLHAVKLLAKTLAQKGLQVNTLHKAARFAGAIDVGQLSLDFLERHHVSWRVASGLTSDQLSPKRREQLISRLESGKLTPQQLGRLLHTKLSPNARSNTRSVLTAHNRARAAILVLQQAKDFGHERADAALAELKELLIERQGE